MYAIDNGLDLPIGDENQLPDDFVFDDDTNVSVFANNSEQLKTAGKIMAAKSIPTDLKEYEKVAKEYYETIKAKNNVSWLKPIYFKRTLKQQLKKDSEVIINDKALWSLGSKE